MLKKNERRSAIEFDKVYPKRSLEGGTIDDLFWPLAFTRSCQERGSWRAYDKRFIRECNSENLTWNQWQVVKKKNAGIGLNLPSHLAYRVIVRLNQNNKHRYATRSEGLELSADRYCSWYCTDWQELVPDLPAVGENRPMLYRIRAHCGSY